MANIERIYTIPLRKEWLKAPKYRRAKKAVAAVKDFLEQHMKSKNVKLGQYLNLHLWERGIKNPPHHVKVRVVKDDTGKVTAELVDAPVPKKETVDQKVKKAEAAKEAKAEDKTEEKKTDSSAASEKKESKPKPAKKKADAKK